MNRAEYKAMYGKERAEIKAALARNRSDVTARTFEKHMRWLEEDAAELRNRGVSEYEIEEFKRLMRRELSVFAGIQNRNYERSDDKEYRKAMGREFQKRKARKRRATGAGMISTGLVVAGVGLYLLWRRKQEA